MINSESQYWHLSHFKLSNGLSKDEMINLDSTLVMEHFRKRDKIGLKRGNFHEVYFLKTGSFKIIHLSDSGEEIIKYIVNEGEIFGLLGLIEGESINDYAVAMEDSTICVIEANSLKEMMNDNAILNNYFFMLAGARIKKLERKLETLVYNDAKTRIKGFILDYINDFGVKLEDHVIAKSLLSNKEIGKLTSTSRQTVNKVLNNLKANQIIDFDEKTIKVSEKILKNNLVYEY